jgi:hypothetical protein
MKKSRSEPKTEKKYKFTPESETKATILSTNWNLIVHSPDYEVRACRSSGLREVVFVEHHSSIERGGLPWKCHSKGKEVREEI